MKKKIGITLVSGLAFLVAFSVLAGAGKVTVKPYGFILFNIQYNTEDVQPFDVPVMAPIGDGDGTTNMFARQSRFGLYVKSNDEVGGADLKGKIELDFWGLRSNSSTNFVHQSAPRLRLAYGTLDWGNTQFTFGQDWMRTFAPLNPVSLAPAETGGIFAPFDEILEAIAAVTAGDSVNIAPGTYSPGPTTITNAVTLKAPAGGVVIQ